MVESSWSRVGRRVSPVASMEVIFSICSLLCTSVFIYETIVLCKTAGINARDLLLSKDPNLQRNSGTVEPFRDATG
jgi:hypothetical protein